MKKYATNGHAKSQQMAIYYEIAMSICLCILYYEPTTLAYKQVNSKYASKVICLSVYNFCIKRYCLGRSWHMYRDWWQRELRRGVCVCVSGHACSSRSLPVHRRPRCLPASTDDSAKGRKRQWCCYYCKMHHISFRCFVSSSEFPGLSQF